jgi:type VI secretion system secreted protein VgrG
MNPLELFGRNRNLAIKSKAVPTIIEGIQSLEVVRIAGSETLDFGDDSIFEYTVLLKTPAELSHIPAQMLLQSFDLASFLGKEATLYIGLDSDVFTPREITGIITSAQFKRVAERALHFEITLKDWLSIGTLNKDFCIHQNKSPVDAIKDTLNATFPYMFDVRTNKQYPIRDYSVRMGESATRYIKRLCQEWSINLHYEHSNGSARLILSDDNNAFKPFPSPAYHAIRYHADTDFIDEEHFHTFSPSRKLTAGSVTYREHSYVAPDATNEVTNSNPAHTRDNQRVNHANAEQYHYHTNAFTNTAQPRAGTEDANDPIAEGQVFTLDHLQSLRQYDDRATAVGNIRAAVVGCSFKLTHHPILTANVDYIVVSANLLVEEIASETQRASAAQEWKVETSLTLQPITIPLKPSKTIAKPRVPSVEVARVVGYKGDLSLWTDDLGRIRVAMPWHRGDPMDETSTCWIRVASNAAGNQQGSMHLPRINDEILISYIGGDPDLPVCTGIVYNSTHMPPWVLPKNQALSGYRSRELKPGNQASGLSNHLVLDDSTDSIQTQLVSEHAQSSLSLGNIRGISGNEGLGAKRGSGFALESLDWGVLRGGRGIYISTYSHDNLSSPIKHMDQTIAQLNRSVSQHKNSTDAAIEHKAYDESLDNATQATLKEQLQAIKGDGEEFPELSQAHLLLSSPVGVQVTTEQSVHIASQEHTGITVGGELSFSVVKRFFASVGSGIRLFAQSKGIWLKSATDPIRLEAQSDNIELYAEKDVQVKGKKVVRIDAGDELIIACQGNYIKMGAYGIEIGSPVKTNHYAPFSVLGNKSLPFVFPHWQGDTSHQFLAKNSDTGKPHVGLAYYFETDDNKTHYGKTDKHGLTERVYSMNTKGIKVLYGVDAQEKIDALLKSDKPSPDESTES